MKRPQYSGREAPPPASELQEYLDQLLDGGNGAAARRSPVPDAQGAGVADGAVDGGDASSRVAPMARASSRSLPFAPPPVTPRRSLPPLAPEPEPPAEPAPPIPSNPVPSKESPVSEMPTASAPAAGTEPPQPPAWSDAPFEALLFRVGGLALAVPLAALGSIRPLEESPRRVVGNADWLLGLIPGNTGNVRVVDTARLVMPERYHASMREHYRYVIALHDCSWGLAVDAIDNALTLVPGQVRWRTRRSRRPWLAGTVMEYMCALLDVEQLRGLLGDAGAVDAD